MRQTGVPIGDWYKGHDDDSQPMLKKGLIRPPRLRTETSEQRERHATWLELFYDLIFVAAISQLAGNLARDYSLTGLLHFSILFVPAQEAWILCASAGICMLSLNTIFLSSYPGRPPDEALRFSLPYYALAVLTVTVGFLGAVVSGIAVLGILTGLSVAQIVYCVRYSPGSNAV